MGNRSHESGFTAFLESRTAFEVSGLRSSTKRPIGKEDGGGSDGGLKR